MKKSDIMKEYKHLQGKIEINFKKISENQKKIVELLNEDDSNWLEIKALNKENEKILLVNQLYIKTSKNFKKMLSQKTDIEDLAFDEMDSIDRVELLNKTKSKELLYNEMHPYYNDITFYEEIFIHFEETEEYEMCKYLLNIKKISKKGNK